MGSPQPKFDNAWAIYLHMHDALRTVTEHGTLQQILSNVSATCDQNYLDELPEDLKPTDKEELLVQGSDDESSISTVNLIDEDGGGGDD